MDVGHICPRASAFFRVPFNPNLLQRQRYPHPSHPDLAQKYYYHRWMTRPAPAIMQLPRTIFAVWILSEIRNTMRNVILAGLFALLSVSILPAPTAQAAPRCFPEAAPAISACIDGRIAEFWARNGGLPVF